MACHLSSRLCPPLLMTLHSSHSVSPSSSLPFCHYAPNLSPSFLSFPSQSTLIFFLQSVSSTFPILNSSAFAYLPPRCLAFAPVSVLLSPQIHETTFDRIATLSKRSTQAYSNCVTTSVIPHSAAALIYSRSYYPLYLNSPSETLLSDAAITSVPVLLVRLVTTIKVRSILNASFSRDLARFLTALHAHAPFSNLLRQFFTRFIMPRGDELDVVDSIGVGSGEPVRVLVTGGTGFIGGNLVRRLLSLNYIVHLVVRPGSQLNQFTSLDRSRLQIFYAHLSQLDVLIQAAENCTFAFHLAFPTAMNVDMEQLFNVAEQGTVNIMRACTNARVRKIIIMSSYVTLAGSGGRRVLNERQWNEHSSMTLLPNYYAKTRAEKIAWKFIQRQQDFLHSNVEFSSHFVNDLKYADIEQCTHINTQPVLVTLIPPVVWGASFPNDVRLPPCKELLVRIAQGEMAGIPDLAIPIVHVKDVVTALLRLMVTKGVYGRYVCCPDDSLIHVRDIVREMRLKGLKPPTKDLSSRAMSAMIKLSSNVFPGGVQGQYIRHHIGNPVRLSNKKIAKQLDMTFVDKFSVLRETIDELVSKGFVDSSEPEPFDISKLTICKKTPLL